MTNESCAYMSNDCKELESRLPLQGPVAMLILHLNREQAKGSPCLQASMQHGVKATASSQFESFGALLMSP